MVNMTEVGVYILGSVALIMLAAAGVTDPAGAVTAITTNVKISFDNGAPVKTRVKFTVHPALPSSC